MRSALQRPLVELGVEIERALVEVLLGQWRRPGGRWLGQWSLCKCVWITVLTCSGTHVNSYEAYDIMLELKERADIILPLHEPRFAAELRASGKPLIGIQINNPRQLHSGGTWLKPTSAQRTARRIRKAGGIPIFLPSAADPKQIDRVLASIDHLVLLGGADITPSLYGKKTTHAVHCNLRRDRYELTLVRKAMARGLGIDGICRGMQLLNVAAGGTLHQDLHKDGVTRRLHRGPFGLSIPHRVTLATDSAVRQAAGTRRLRAPSFHHQGLDRIGRGLRVTGRAPDGVAEVLESADGRIRGYQFHPERSRTRSSGAIFADMVRRAAAARPPAQPQRSCR